MSLCFFVFLSVRDTHIRDIVSTTNVHPIAFLSISTVTFYVAVLRFHSLKHYLVTFSGNSCFFSLFCFFLYRDFRSRSGEEIVYILFSLVFPKFFIKNWISHECFHRVYVLIRYIEVSSAINNAPAYRLFITFSSITRQLRQYESWKQR